MTTPSPKEVTQLLIDWGKGDQAALDKLQPLVDAELRRLAGRYMRRESPGHTLQTSALVNEAYLRLIEQKSVHWQNRANFFGGLTTEEVAEVLKVTPRTIEREWRKAKAWLHHAISKGEADEA